MERTALALCLAIAFVNSDVSAIVSAEAQEQTVQSLLGEAATAQSRGDFASAAEFYRKATEIGPSIPELWANLGLMDHQIGKSSDAIQSFRHAIRLNPNLFVPQLFLGIEYLAAKNPAAALPYLETAEKLGPGDLQTALSLGSAYQMLNRPDRAAGAYLRATEIAPKNGNAWLDLGTTYLQLVEDDARVMTSEYNLSAYSHLRAAETYAEEDKLGPSEDAYKAALASGSTAPCAHAEFGITLLRLEKVAEARDQFELETKSGSHCGLTPMGEAVAQLATGHADEALTKLTAVAMADPGFVASSLPLFRGAVSADQIKSLSDLASARQNDAIASVNMGSLIERGFSSTDPPATGASAEDVSPSSTPAPPAWEAERLYANGQYAKCSEALRPTLGSISYDRLQRLAVCSFSTGDFETSSKAAQRLKLNPVTRLQGLYWESKADQKLAISALVRAGEIDGDSPRMHVLLGDSFRQARNLDEAEAEYRKAVALDPKSRAARLSLAITLFSEQKTGEAFDMDRSLLSEDRNDPEANLLAGEILVQQEFFAEAEPYLSNCRNLKPEFVPHLHALLGKVYAETDRIPEAISEYKAGLSADEDGSIHYQLARIYQKSGNREAADAAFNDSKRLRRQWDDRAHIALGQSSTDPGNQ